MNAKTNESLLPQIFNEKLEVGLPDSSISLKDLEISTGKPILEVVSERLCSLPIMRAKNIWKALDQPSKNELVYQDYGAFNLELIEKLDIKANELQLAFYGSLSKEFFELDNAPLCTPEYSSAFLTIQGELLSTCRQLYSAQPNGKERLLEFLNNFEIEQLASVVRHEIARYYIDEQGGNLEWDIAISETGGEFIDDDDSETEDILEEPDEFNEKEVQHSELAEFKRLFVNGYNVPSVLEFTSWIQNNLPEIYADIRNVLLFFSKEQEINVWDRPNPAEAEPGTYEPAKPIKLEDGIGSLNLFGSDKKGLISVDFEREERRLIRLYSINHPLKNDFQKIYLQDFEKQGEFVAKILMETGMDTHIIQTFGELKKSLWDAIGFTGLKQWVNKQEEPLRLIESSGKKQLFDEMNVLGREVFGENAILYESPEQTKQNVFKLYGWFCLLKIFWNIAKENRRFSDLASVIDDKIVWDETITVNTLIFQVVLNTNRMFFSLNDVVDFCNAAKDPEWCNTMKESFEELAKNHDAVSAIPVFHEKIERLKSLSENIFLIADQIRLGTKIERQMVEDVKLLAKEHYQDYLASICHELKSDDEVKEAVGLSFVIKMKMIREIEPYQMHAQDLFDLQIDKASFKEFSKRSESGIEGHEGDENTEDVDSSEIFKNVMDIIKKDGANSDQGANKS